MCIPNKAEHSSSTWNAVCSSSRHFSPRESLWNAIMNKPFLSLYFSMNYFSFYPIANSVLLMLNVWQRQAVPSGQQNLQWLQKGCIHPLPLPHPEPLPPPAATVRTTWYTSTWCYERPGTRLSMYVWVVDKSLSIGYRSRYPILLDQLWPIFY